MSQSGTPNRQIRLATAAGGPLGDANPSVVQTTSISTAVTLNALRGTITTVSQTIGAGSEAEFQVNNNWVSAHDVVAVCIKDHTSAGEFIAAVSAVANGSFKIRLSNLHASAAGNNVLVLNFIVLKSYAE